MVDELLVECPHRVEGCQETMERQMVQVHLREACVYGEGARQRKEGSEKAAERQAKKGKDKEKEEVFEKQREAQSYLLIYRLRSSHAHIHCTGVHSHHLPHQSYQPTWIHAHMKHSKISFLPTTLRSPC